VARVDVVVRRILQDQPPGHQAFPDKAINAETERVGKPSRFDEHAIEYFLSTTYSKATAFLALSLVQDESAGATAQYHQDHIFPQSLFSDERLAAAGVPAEKWAGYRELSNRIANLQLLRGQENEAKSDQQIDEWLRTRDGDFRRRHLIPEDDALLHPFRFEDFVAGREGLMRERLWQLFSTETLGDEPSDYEEAV
jgi:hypothetical protein